MTEQTDNEITSMLPDEKRAVGLIAAIAMLRMFGLFSLLPVLSHYAGTLEGQTLLDIQADDYSNAETQQQSKALMRTLINHHLGNQTLHTRSLLRDLQQF